MKGLGFGGNGRVTSECFERNSSELDNIQFGVESDSNNDSGSGCEREQPRPLSGAFTPANEQPAGQPGMWEPYSSGRDQKSGAFTPVEQSEGRGPPDCLTTGRKGKGRKWYSYGGKGASNNRGCRKSPNLPHKPGNPHTTPRKPTTNKFVTPEQISKFIQNCNKVWEASPDGKTKEVILKSLKEAQTAWKEMPYGRKRTDLGKRIAHAHVNRRTRAGRRTRGITDRSNLDVQRLLHRALGCRTERKIAEIIFRNIVRGKVYDVNHVCEDIEESGFHFCPVDDLRRSQLFNCVTFAQSEVWFARRDTGKPSSFYPDYVENDEQLVELTSKARTVASCLDDKYATLNLKLCTHKGNKFYFIEVLESGFIIKTFYPLLHLEDLRKKPEGSFEIKYTKAGSVEKTARVEKADILNQPVDILQDQVKIFDTKNNSCLLDISKIVKIPNVRFGIYVWVSAKDLPEELRPTKKEAKKGSSSGKPPAGKGTGAAQSA